MNIEELDDNNILNNKSEKKIVLLPGNEFVITNITTINVKGFGNVFYVVLNSTFNVNNEKYKWYKNIMREIIRIK